MNARDAAATAFVLVSWVLGVLGITLSGALAAQVKAAIVAGIAAVTIAHRVVGYLDRRNQRATALAARQATPAVIEQTVRRIVTEAIDNQGAVRNGQPPAQPSPAPTVPAGGPGAAAGTSRP